MKKVAIYIRVSTEDQKTDMQLSDLSSFVKQRGYEIYKVYEDKISGKTKNRPQFNEMIKEAKQRKFDVVLVWKFDRFARSLKMLVEYLELFNELGIDFVSFKENIDTTTSMGRLIFHINSAYAEFERELIGERVKSGIKEKRKKTNGKWGRSTIDVELQNKIKDLIESGLSIRKTAKRLEVAVRTVMKYK